VEVVSLNTDGEEQRRQILTIERRETGDGKRFGVNLTEGKALLGKRAGFCCLPTGHAKSWSNDVPVHAAAGDTRPRTPAAPQLARYSAELRVPNPRWNRCGCPTEGPRTFRPMRTWLNGQNQPRNAISGEEVGILDPRLQERRIC